MTPSPGSSPSFEVAERQDLNLPMRDGATLAVDLYLPARNGRPIAGPFPTLVERTPYNKRREVLEITGRWFAERGYAVVMQDVRGRYGSSGQWRFLPPGEGTDGLDTLNWITTQPWSDGKVATMGLSYSATNQQTLALERPPALATQIICDGGYNYHHRTLRHGGALELGVALPYVIRMAREGQELAREPARLAEFEAACGGLERWFRTLPLDFDNTPLRLAPGYERWFLDMLRTADYTDYWKHAGWNLEEHVDRHPDLPVLLQTSWYGHHIWGTTEKYSRLREQGSENKKLLIGHWTHGYDSYAQSWCGEVDFGPDSAIELNSVKLRWFDQCLRGIDTGIFDEPPVRLFVMGGGSGRRNRDGRIAHGGVWRNENEWPPARVCPTRYFLHPAGHGDRNQDGALLPGAPDPDTGPSRYRYDPLHPVPTVGGGTQNTDFPFLPAGGAFDQRCRKELVACGPEFAGHPLAERDDVLVFQTPPLEQPVEVTGPIAVKLWIASSTVDTDFTAKLVDVYPPAADSADGHGFALNLTDGVQRTRYRNSRDRSELMAAGEVYPIEFELQATSNLFAARHRIRLDISSSNFPRFDPNPNTGDALGSNATPRVAENVIFHDASRPSHIILPVISR